MLCVLTCFDPHSFVFFCKDLTSQVLSYIVETLAAQVEDTAGCYFVPAFTGLFCPHWQPDARG